MAGQDRKGELAADYRRAGFGARLGFGTRPALLLVDFVRAYTDPASALHAGESAERARRAAVTLLDAARRAGILIAMSRVEYQPGGADGGLFYRKVPALRLFDRGSPFGAPAAGLAPDPGEIVVTKHYASAFFGTSLASSLRAHGIDSCLIAGMSTSGCVRATALDALQHGFLPLVVTDACGDRDPAVHEANLFDLDAKYADVISLAEALKMLEALSQSASPGR
ncbi:MAG: N-carbamoylsarcosine amidohydrolase [Rhodothalassiaceae bacterium]